MSKFENITPDRLRRINDALEITVEQHILVARELEEKPAEIKYVINVRERNGEKLCLYSSTCLYGFIQMEDIVKGLYSIADHLLNDDDGDVPF